MGLEYLYDPFSTKSFNFADEDRVNAGFVVQERLVQAMHEFRLEPRWRAKWSKRIRTEARVELSARLPEFPSDKRYAARLELSGRWGKLRGFYAQTGVDMFVKRFPEYQIADRRIDQQGLRWYPKLGWVFDNRSRVSLSYLYDFIDYADARYDTLSPAGEVIRAQESKNYVSHSVVAQGTLRVAPALRLKGRYKLQLHDSVNYDREMTGVDGFGNREARYIRDYYDFTRHRVMGRVVWSPGDFEVSGLVELWLRDFSTYEVRDADNVWKDEFRQDTSVELGVEASYLLLTFADDTHEFRVTGFLSHLDRGSNMTREVSFATNYAITRVFFGVELRRD